MKCLTAWTETSGKTYPEYINISVDGDDVVVVLREAPYFAENGTPCNGNTASTRIPAGEFLKNILVPLVREAQSL